MEKRIAGLMLNISKLLYPGARELPALEKVPVDERKTIHSLDFDQVKLLNHDIQGNCIVN